MKSPTKVFLYLAIIMLVCCVVAAFINDGALAVISGGLAVAWLIMDGVYSMMRRD